MDRFQQKTAALFTRMRLERAVDEDDEEEIIAMSRRMDELTLLALRFAPDEQDRAHYQ